MNLIIMSVPTLTPSNFFFNDTATTEIYTTVHTLSLHDALPIYAALPADLLLQAAPVGETAGEAHERGVRGDRENAAAQLPLEAVHDRQHDDERRHPERQPAHRDQRDEGYEAAPVGRAQIARADEPFVGAHRYS